MLPFIVLAGLLAITIGCLFFATRRKLHVVFKIVLWIIAIGSACGFVLGSFTTFLFWQPDPPSLPKLAKSFPERRQTLTEILNMSNLDQQYLRIDPTFIYSDAGEFMWGDVNSPLAKDRWNQYRGLFSRAHLDQGITRDPGGDVFFMAGSVGLLNRGYSTGYLFCKDPGSPSSQNSRFEPCTLPPQDSGSRIFQAEPRVEAYSFKRLADHWYVFSQGPR